jgi:hypothetical protein
MSITGTITDYDGKRLIISAPFSDVDFLLNRRVAECEVLLSDGRHITPLQRRYVYAILRDIGAYTGHEVEYLKDYFKADCIARTGGEWFSMSDCSMTQANEMIDVLIEFCVEWGIPTKDSLIRMAPEIGRYLYICLLNKKCAICGRKAELHHENRIGAGRNRNKIVHLGLKAEALCRAHHREVDQIGQITFNEKYKVFGIPLDERLCKVWRLKYVRDF